MDLDNLISQAKDLMSKPSSSPLQDVFDQDVVNYVKAKFGSSLADILNTTLWSGIVPSSDAEADQQRRLALTRGIEFLESLKLRRPSPEPINVEQTKQSVKERFGNITINGPATFGDNSPISQVTTNEFLTALADEVAKLPESDAKRTLLDNLRDILANPSFASIAGSTIGVVIGHLLGGHSVA